MAHIASKFIRFRASLLKGKYQIRLDKVPDQSDYLPKGSLRLDVYGVPLNTSIPISAYTDIDLDSTLVKAIPQVKAARTPDQYRQRIRNLLQVSKRSCNASCRNLLRLSRARPFSSSSAKKEPMYFRVVDGFVIVIAIDWTRALASGDNSVSAKQAEMMTEIGKAKGIIARLPLSAESPTPN